MTTHSAIELRHWKQVNWKILSFFIFIFGRRKITTMPQVSSLIQGQKETDSIGVDCKIYKKERWNGDGEMRCEMCRDIITIIFNFYMARWRYFLFTSGNSWISFECLRNNVECVEFYFMTLNVTACVLPLFETHLIFSDSLFFWVSQFFFLLMNERSTTAANFETRTFSHFFCQNFKASCCWCEWGICCVLIQRNMIWSFFSVYFLQSVLGINKRIYFMSKNKWEWVELRNTFPSAYTR